MILLDEGSPWSFPHQRLGSVVTRQDAGLGQRAESNQRGSLSGRASHTIAEEMPCDDV